MGQYILSGSQNFLLLKQISQTLAGRVAILKLLPLSYEELQKSNLLSDSIAENIFRGTYPATFDRQLSSEEFYPSYLETYIQRDVRDLIEIKDLRTFQIFLKLCAGRIGQPLNLSSLASDCGISSPTAKSWLLILESSFIVYTLSPYYKNFSKRLIKSPKLYFYDTGLACYLLNMTEIVHAENYYQRGCLFENAMISEMIKNRFNQAKSQALYFWQDSNKNEIDLLEEKGDKINTFEMKYSMTVTKEQLKNLHLFRGISSISGESYLIYAGDETELRTNVTVVSWKKIVEL